MAENLTERIVESEEKWNKVIGWITEIMREGDRCLVCLIFHVMRRISVEYCVRLIIRSGISVDVYRDHLFV